MVTERSPTTVLFDFPHGRDATLCKPPAVITVHAANKRRLPTDHMLLGALLPPSPKHPHPTSEDDTIGHYTTADIPMRHASSRPQTASRVPPSTVRHSVGIGVTIRHSELSRFPPFIL